MVSEVADLRPSIGNPGVLLATWFGAGYMPKAPGTWGSALALPFAWGILTISGVYGLLAASLIVFAIGIWAANDYMGRTGTDDPGPVVIDEVVGQWLVLTVVPMELPWFLVGFALFRLFDIVKPWPVNLMDQRIKGGLGVMLDDVGAGIYAAGAAYGVIYLINWLQAGV